MPRKHTQESFVTKCKEIHGDLYDYSLVDYKNVNSKIKIICKTHGIFEQRCDHHLEGKHCRHCKFDQKSKFRKYTREEFIEQCKIKHNNFYTYENTSYDKIKGRIEITCPTHGAFTQIADKHLNGGDGCPNCKIVKVANAKRIPFEQHIKDFIAVHGNKYDYSKAKPVDSIKEKIYIICKLHGGFRQILQIHKNGANCPKCKLQSKNEYFIIDFLTKNNISFTYQKQFDDCVNTVTGRRLRFDFYLEEHNLIIEYDGVQHFKIIDHWGGVDGLEMRKKLDTIKDEYCKNKDIKILRIHYKENVEELLTKHLLQ